MHPSSQPSEVPSVSSIPSSQPSTQPSIQSSETPSKSNIPSRIPSPTPTSDSPTQTLSPSICVPSPSSCCNVCGSFAGDGEEVCYCDSLCQSYNNCCVDFASKCPSIEASCITGINVCEDSDETPFDAEVGSGSCSGDFACAGASGNIGETSCFDFRACYQFGYTFATQEDPENPFARSLQELKKPIIFPPFAPFPPLIKVEGSSIGESSCLGESACDSASGTIGSSSCIGTNACSFVPFKLGDGGIGKESELFPSSSELVQGDFKEGSALFQNKQVIEGEKYLAKSILPFTRSLEEIQQPSIGDNSCSGSSACELNTGNIGDASCTKGFDGKEPPEPPSCIDNRGRIGNDSCTEHASCIGNRGRIGNGSW